MDTFSQIGTSDFRGVGRAWREDGGLTIQVRHLPQLWHIQPRHLFHLLVAGWRSPVGLDNLVLKVQDLHHMESRGRDKWRSGMLDMIC